ncbi:hypothetical protein [Aquamicrobium soli]|uniref:Uncharacterized protein n=1 Tax=Aquamicrobium soli TaxID=1811518 RepID=A0ABV7KD22_9HYPH
MKPHSLMWRAARWVISRAANLTPEVVYYADGWPAKINGKLTEFKNVDDGEQSAFATAAIAICCASHAQLKIGDTMTAKMSGVTRRKIGVGDFEVSVRRAA